MTNTNIYQSLYDLLNTYVYGGELLAGSHQDLVATLLATIGVVFLVALPFMLVLKVIRMIGG